MTIVDEARDLARQLHAAQVRRESGRSFFETHLTPVAEMVAANGGDELAVAAAYCHDILEDVGEEHMSAIAAISPDLLAIVEQLAERGDTWEDEKQGYVEGVGQMNERALLVSICDKTCNARDFVAEWRQGKLGKRPAQIIWFLGALLEAYEARDRALQRERDYRGLLWDLHALVGEMQELYR
jgi:(p)ppGpp synthase/HD superfamily hydrolase